MNKLIDIAFSGFWQFCGVMLLLGLLANLIASVANSFASIFKKNNHENQP